MGVNWTASYSPAPPGESLSRLPRPRPAKAGIGEDIDIGFERVAQRVRAEYLEMPGLNLTRQQAQVLWGLDAELCDRLLTYLLDTGFLARTVHGTFVRVG